MNSNLAIDVGLAPAHAQPAIAPWWQVRRDVPALAPASQGSPVAFAALVAFTVILLLSPQAWFPVLKVARIAFLAAGLAAAAHVIERTARRRSIMPISPEIGIAVTLLCWSVLTLPVSVWPGGSVQVLTEHYVKAIAFFWLLGTIITTTERLRIMVWTLTLCAIPLAVTGIVNYVLGEVISTGASGFYRISGYYMSGLTANPNDLALMLNLIIPLTGALIVGERGLKRSVAAAALLVCVAAVILSFSRAGFLTLAATFVMGFVMLVRQKKAFAAAGLVVLALCAQPFLPDGYVDRIGTITNIQEDATGSAQGRWRDTKVAAGLVIKNPIVGAGIGQDVLVMNDERGIDTWRRVHNAYLQYGVDLGLPGLLLFIWLHLTCYRTSRTVAKRASADPALRRLEPLAAGVTISLVVFSVAAMFHPIAYQFYFFSIAGLAVALRNVYTTAAAERASSVAADVASTFRRTSGPANAARHGYGAGGSVR
jgi:probable O-glycosylation ligase (exosortase A-associated)